MNGNVVGVCPVADVVALLRGHRRSTGHIVRILETDQASCRTVIIVLKVQGTFDLAPFQMAASIMTAHRPQKHAGDHRCRRHLVKVDVAAVFDDDLVARSCVNLDGDLIGHAAGRDEQSGLAFKYLGGTILKAIYRRVLTIDVVAYFGGGHRCTHRVSWLCNCVASEIDHSSSILPRMLFGL